MERDQADSLLPILEEPIPENDLEETPKEPTNPDAFIDHSIIPEVLGQPARSENASSAQEDQAKGPRHSNGSNISTPSLFQAFKTKAWKTLLGHEDLDEWRSTLSEQRSRLQTREESLRSRKEQIDDADLREIKELERRENELDQRQMGLEELEDQLNQREIRLDEWEERLDQRGMELDQQEARLEELEYAFQTWKDQLRSQEGQLEVLDTHMCEANARDGHIGNRVREPWQRQEIFNQRGKRLNEQQSTVQTWKEQSQLGGKEHSHAGSREQDPRDKVIRARVGELGLREVTFVQREEQVQSQEEQLGASKREQRPKDLEEPNQETGCCPQPSMEKANVSERASFLESNPALLSAFESFSQADKPCQSQMNELFTCITDQNGTSEFISRKQVPLSVGKNSAFSATSHACSPSKSLALAPADPKQQNGNSDWADATRVTLPSSTLLPTHLSNTTSQNDIDEETKRQIWQEGYDASHLEWKMHSLLLHTESGVCSHPQTQNFIYITDSNDKPISLSPERVAQFKDLDRRIDMYDIGNRIGMTVVWQILCRENGRLEWDPNIYKRGYVWEDVDVPFQCREVIRDEFWRGVSHGSEEAREAFAWKIWVEKRKGQAV